MKLYIALLATISLSSLIFSSFTLANEKAKTFQLPSLTTDQQVDLTEFKGKVVYLDFWASWCKPCVKSFPVLNEFHQKYQQQGFEVIAINLDENKKNAEAFLQQNPVEYTVLYDQGAKIAQSYKVQAMPSSYFIDRAGKIRLTHKGYKDSDKEKIEKVIQLLLKEK